MGTYSFLDVQAAISGPGGAFSLSGVGNAEEGISVAFSEEKDTLTVGADGTPMHSLHAGKAGKVMVRLLKTSPANQQLAQLYAYQTSSSALHGQNVITIADTSRGDIYTCQACAFAKFPDNAYAKDGAPLEWEFNVGIIDGTLGGGA